MVTNLNIDCHVGDLTETVINDVEIIQECYSAIQEGGTDPDFLVIAQKYTKSLIIEVLESIHNFLLKFLEQIVRRFNAYAVNSARSANKYRETIIAKIGELVDNPVIYESFEYPGLYEYPKEFKMSQIETDEIISELKRLYNSDNKLDMDPASFIDKKINEFGKAVLDHNVEPDDLAYSVEKICKKIMKGSSATYSVTSNNISRFYDDMSRTLKERVKLTHIRKEINQYYSMLRREVEKMYHTPKQYVPSDLNFKNAEMTMSSYSGDVTRFELDRNKLFNAYLVIYRVAFTTKLNILNEKIEQQSAVIAAIFKRTSIFTHTTTGREIIKEENRIVSL